MNIFLTKKSFILKGLGVVFILLFFSLLYKMYIPRISAFGCFDDCFNFMGGYFLLHGKKIYADFFFNHNPLMAYLSLTIQWLAHPINIFDLILRHRQFLLVFGLVMDIILFLRFGFPVLVFALFYELTKFYLFGDRFLAESFIPYPLAYMIGTALQQIIQKKQTWFDLLFCAFAAWFVIFMREPFVPLALFLFGFVLWQAKVTLLRIWSIGFFLILSGATLLLHNLSAFFFNVYTVNVARVFSQENTTTGVLGIGIWKAFFYPLIILFSGQWTYFRYILVSVDIVFIFSAFFLLYKKLWREILVIFLCLGFASLRIVPPGSEYYASFHMNVWYALFIFSTATLITYIVRLSRKVGLVLFLIVGSTLLYNILTPRSFLHDTVDEHTEFITNYGPVLQLGIVIDDLSTPKDTLFLDGFDDMIYYTSQRVSPYRYSWYTSSMPQFAIYTKARTHMFETNPPDFYYGSCTSWKNNTNLPFIQANYQVLYTNNKPSCLWVKKTKIPQISEAQWKKAQDAFYALPKNIE